MWIEKRVAVFGAVLCCWGAVAAADDRERLPSGVRLRVTSNQEGGPVVGRLGAVDPKAVSLEVPGRGLVTFPQEEIVKLEVSRGKRSRAVEGGVMGVIALPIVGCAATRPCLGPGTVVLAALGGLGGAAIGNRLSTERWEVVRVRDVRVVVKPAAAAVTASISIGF